MIAPIRFFAATIVALMAGAVAWTHLGTAMPRSMILQTAWLPWSIGLVVLAGAWGARAASGWLLPLLGGSLAIGACALPWFAAEACWIGLAGWIGAAGHLASAAQQHRPWPAAAAATLFAVAMGMLVVSTQTTTGDEPHYLMLAASLWEDGDRNQFDEYASNEARHFFWGVLGPKPSDIIGEESVHSQALGIAYPWLMAIGYGLGGRLGATLLNGLMLAGAWWGMVLLCRRWGLETSAAALGAAMLASSLPACLFFGQIYPETLGACACVLGLAALESKNLRWAMIGLIALFAAMLLTKVRYYPIVACLAVAFLARLARERRGLFWAFGAGIAGVGALFLATDALLLDGDFIFHRFGTLYQLSHYAPDLGMLIGGVGLLVDQEAGLLMYAPVFVAGLAGLAVGKLQSQAPWRLLWALLLSNFAVISAHPMWHSLPTPPGRYLVPVLPLLTPFLAVLLGRRRGLALALWVASGLLGLGVLHQWLWRGNQGIGVANHLASLERTFDLPFSRLVPSLVRLEGRDMLLAGLWLMLVAGIGAGCGRLRDWWGPGSLALAMGALALAAEGVAPPLADAEGSWEVVRRQGLPFPENPDLYFHMESRRGWTLRPGEGMALRLHLGGTGRLLAMVRATGEAPALALSLLGRSRAIDIPEGMWTPVAWPLSGLEEGLATIELRHVAGEGVHVGHLAWMPEGSLERAWRWHERAAALPWQGPAAYLAHRAWHRESPVARLRSMQRSALRAEDWDLAAALAETLALRREAPLPGTATDWQRLNIGLAFVKGGSPELAEAVLAASAAPKHQFVAAVAAALRSDAETALQRIEAIPKTGDFVRLKPNNFVTEDPYLRYQLQHVRRDLIAHDAAYQVALRALDGR